ncbi:hypothetical protein C4573_04600 [Candidatus Woesearchaeota archaeon]|nr:MAG: hypothetical protein C4573_04600 [Candidatus Woesearchaeota archaeon]
MNQKQIGMIVILLGILLGIFVYAAKVRSDNAAEALTAATGSCFLEDGTCLHESGSTFFLLGGIIAAALLILGVYLFFFDKTQTLLVKQHAMVSTALKEAKKHEKAKDEFKAFLSGFTDEEQKIILAIHEQEGVQQSTLRYRLGMSKATLSLLLQSLEKKDIISKKAEGKTNKLYLRKKF